MKFVITMSEETFKNLKEALKELEVIEDYNYVTDVIKELFYIELDPKMNGLDLREEVTIQQVEDNEPHICFEKSYKNGCKEFVEKEA